MPVAALTTFITNPLTTPIIWVIAYRIGTFLLRSETPINTQPVAEAATGWLQWALSAFHWLWEQGPAFGLGLCVLTGGCAVIGYAASALGWRVRIARKWRNRRKSVAI